MKKSIVTIIHLAYWFCYAILLFYIFHILSLSQKDGIDRSVYFLKMATGFAIVPALASFYCCYTVAFDELLKKKRIIALIFSIVAQSYAAASLGGIVLKLLIKHNLLFDNGWLISIPLTFLMSVIPMVHAVLAIGMRSFIAWYGDIKVKEDLKNKNYETELALVKSQIDPHFLFNTINNIDTLIELNAASASDYLNKLSDIMRFMLYESKTEKLPVAKELAYIEKYIELQKIRTSNKNFVSLQVKGDVRGLVLESMLFIPFIENAFKHAENVLEDGAISITFEFADKEIIFSCENKYVTPMQASTKYKGLGNELIKKRLALLYPGKHLLAISHENKIYKVTLKIDHED